jgi:hypothetical protein
MLKVEDPHAYRFILQDEVYLLEKDKLIPEPTADAVQPTPQRVALPASQTQVETPPAAPVAEVKTPEATFNYLGSNNKNFVILTNYANQQFIAAAHLIALQNILKRKGLELDDVAIFNIQPYAPVKMGRISKEFSPAKMLILGKEAMPADMPPLKFNTVIKGKKTDVIFTYSFDEMIDSNDMKKAFWEEVKKL